MFARELFANGQQKIIHLRGYDARLRKVVIFAIGFQVCI